MTHHKPTFVDRSRRIADKPFYLVRLQLFFGLIVAATFEANLRLAHLSHRVDGCDSRTLSNNSVYETGN